ncbi:serine hydrolase [Bacillus sp. M6-12]|uniref:serine hydrolase domain-containing protein n=1 Tax=Bacillus sp. M6-12 TaxID=2054166 RepID=UPI000C77C540|nr:serine hydrolase [Bacillus sp. M6-12]PLS16141.1 serine hydrolase [Bacillus sp. M6-12]
MNQLTALMEDGLKNGIQEKLFPGGIASVSKAGLEIQTATAGNHSYGTKAKQVTSESVFDLASLTKVTAALPAILLSIQEGKLLLFDSVEEYIPEFCTGQDAMGKKQITIFHLLTHTSGLPGWRPYYISYKGRSEYINAISQEPLIGSPGKQVVYSDLGFMLLGFILERVWDTDLTSLTQQLIYKPLKMSQTGYLPLERGTPIDSIVATEQGNRIEREMGLSYLEEIKQNTLPKGAYAFTPEELKELKWRTEVIVGTVHDCNAFYGLDGVSGHAGLFSTVNDLHCYMQVWSEPNSDFIDPVLKRLSAGLQTSSMIPTRGLGWEASSTGGTMEQKLHSCSGGEVISPEAFGHTGFTGTFMWHDPARQSSLIILTNRVHSDSNRSFFTWRKKFCNTVFSNSSFTEK